jgi:hypothetical protein
MLKDKNPLLKLNLTEKKFILTEICIKIYESFYKLFDIILEDPIENFWFEFIGIVMGYSQILYYLIDRTVSEY